MKELGKRFRGLFVLLLAATFFLQGGWFMPAEAATGDEYLIILQVSSNIPSSYLGVKTDYPGGVDAFCYDAESYGVFKGSAGAIESLITGKKIGTGAGQTLDLGSEPGVTELKDINALSKSITAPEGETVYVLYNSNVNSGAYCDLKNADGDSVGTYMTGCETEVKKYDRDSSDYAFKQIDNVRNVKSASIDMKKPTSDIEKYYDFSNDTWNDLTSDRIINILSDTAEYRGVATYNTDFGYTLVFNMAKPAIKYTAPDVTVKYDGKPHGIKVTVTDPTTEYEIRYGTTKGKYDEIESPEFTEPGTYTVYYQINAGPNYEIATGSAKVTITKDEPVVTKYTITYDLDGGTLDGMTGTVTEKHPAGAVITLPAPTKDGYTFDHWEGSTYYAGDKYTVTGDHTFKAVWKTGAGGNGKKGSGTKTGDENALGAWIVLLLAAMAGTTGMVYARKRKGE